MCGGRGEGVDSGRVAGLGVKTEGGEKRGKGCEQSQKRVQDPRLNEPWKGYEHAQEILLTRKVLGKICNDSLRKCS